MGDITVTVVDDQAMVRQGFAALLGAQPDITVVGDAADGAQAVEQVTRLHPDVVFMDVPGAPVVDRARLGSLGIESMRTYGRQSAMGEWRYNEVALEQVLEAIVGRARYKVPGKGANVQRDSADEARTGEAGTQVQSGQTLAYGRRNTLVG